MICRFIFDEGGAESMAVKLSETRSSEAVRNTEHCNPANVDIMPTLEKVDSVSHCTGVIAGKSQMASVAASPSSVHSIQF